jgi:hypothetical protein
MTNVRLFFVGEDREAESAVSLMYDHNFVTAIDRTIVFCHDEVDTIALSALYGQCGIDTTTFTLINDREFIHTAQINVHSNWLKQQMVKLFALDWIDAENILIQDADIFPLVPYSWIDQYGAVVPVVFKNTSHAPEYYQYVERILQIPRQTPDCFVTDLLPISKQSWNKLKQHIETIHNTPWWAALQNMMQADFDIIQSKIRFSEYELLGNWMTYQSTYNSTITQVPELITMTSTLSISKETNFISMELWDAHMNTTDIKTLCQDIARNTP